MNRFLTLPILLPVVLGIGLLILQPKTRRTRDRYVMASSLATSVLSLICVVLTYFHDSGYLACILVSFSEMFSISLRIDGASMVYGGIVSVLWPLVTAYSLDYMSHEGHENRFFGFWLMAYGVVLGIAYSEDFPLSVFLLRGSDADHASAGDARHGREGPLCRRKYLVYSLSGAAFAFIGIVFLLNYGVGHLNFTYGGFLDPTLTAGDEFALEAAFVAAFFGFGVKAAVFPFHGWLPECLCGAHAGVRPAPRGGGGEGRRLRGAAADLLWLRSGLSPGDLGADRGDDGDHRHHRLRLRPRTADAPSEAAAGLFHGQQPVLHPLALTLMTPAGIVGGMTHMVYHAFTKITMFCCAGAIIVKSGAGVRL